MSKSNKMGEARPPVEGASVQFWTLGMSMQKGRPGIQGNYRLGRFESLDGSQHWPGRQVHYWCFRKT